MKKTLIILIVLLSMSLVSAQDVGTISQCEDCVCEDSSCVLCNTPGNTNQASYAVFNYEQYDPQNCDLCRLKEDAGGIYPLDSEYSAEATVRYADGEGNWIIAGCGESFDYELPLEGIVYPSESSGFQSSICPEPRTREIQGCGFYTKEVLCDTSGGFADPEWHTLVALRVPTADSCSEPQTFECGNGILEQGEQCEDGNTENGDGCSSLCLLERKENSEKGNLNPGMFSIVIVAGIIVLIAIILITRTLIKRFGKD